LTRLVRFQRATRAERNALHNERRTLGYLSAMVRRVVAGVVLVAASLALWSGGAADAKGVCLTRALEQGYATRNEFGAIVYAPYLPTAEDYEACSAVAPAVPAAPAFTG
jgi:hypothetical protein